MIEKLIYLKSVDPLLLYGANNQHLELIKRFFPKIKLIARGDQLKAIGPAGEITRFEKKMEELFNHLDKYNRLTALELEGILVENGPINGIESQDDDLLIFGNNGKPIRARTPHQKEMVEKYHSHDLLIATGPAGSGKTYIAVALAVRALRNREVKRVILSRPAVESGEHLGFLPGDLREKLDPYLQPLYDALLDMMPARKLKEYMEDNVIQIAPLAFMRGRTLENAFVILDEAQNASVNQLKMFLTRMGENSKFAVTGDITQIDLPDPNKSGLVHAREILTGIDGIALVEFSRQDIIRHKLVEKIVNAYEQKS
ncbi:MAG: PhoH family protein [Bacteroidales bacterium]|jgi:phosphate starvation-inducible PhoH-like protein|nr:PhoH family protein [Bacteroidales bacterium]MDD2812923.1 PhoH family protein [Bacteroidales bacterium]MDD3384982.1 PhoH family protein [Bacteroidales bacterium]MDD3811162.1 PhoH family protein [Bacteroidales bacterium]